MSEQPQRSWFGRNWIWVVPVGCLTPILLCGGFVAVILMTVFGMIKSSPPYVESLAAVQENPQAQQQLGVPIEPGFLVGGEINTSGTSGNADISYSVSGPDGSGTVYAVAEKSAGQWKFESMILELSDSGERIDLQPPE